MGQESSIPSSLTPEIIDLIFDFLPSAASSPLFRRDQVPHQRPSSAAAAYPTLCSLTLTSKALNEIAIPLLYRRVRIDLGDDSQTLLLHKTLDSRPELHECVWEVEIRAGMYELRSLLEEELEMNVKCVCELLERATGLRRLALENVWEPSEREKVAKRFLEAVSAHTNLSQLEVSGYGGPILHNFFVPTLVHNLLYLHIEKLPLFPLEPKSFPTLHTLHFDHCLPHATQVDLIAPQIRKVILHGRSEHFGKWLLQFPHTEHFHHIATSGVFFDQPWPEPLPAVVDLVPIRLLEIDLRWEVEEESRTEALEQAAEIMFSSRAIEKLVVRLWMDKNEEKVGSPSKVAEEAKTAWKLEGTELEVNWRYM